LQRIGYIEGDSFAHRLDPVSKIVVLLSFCVFAIFEMNTNLMVAGFVLVMAMVSISGIGLVRGLRKLRAVVVLCVALFLFQVIFNKSGGPILNPIPSGLGEVLLITTGGIRAGARIALRLMIIVLASLFFVGTTDPSTLAYSLMKRGIPYRYGFTFILAMRFVPLFQAEASTVRRAQTARGLRIDRPGPRSLMRLARYTFVPLLVSAFRRVGEISVSMEGRGFGLRSERGYLRVSRFRFSDLLVCLTSLALTSLALYLG